MEDRRASGSSGGGGIGGRGIGIGTIAIALAASFFFGIHPMTMLNILSGGGAPEAQVAQGPAQRPPADDRMAKFVGTVLADTEDEWKDVFTTGGATYTEPKLVLFRGVTGTMTLADMKAAGQETGSTFDTTVQPTTWSCALQP